MAETLKPGWVIVFKDGRYTYGWGDTPIEALRDYLHKWEEGILRVVPAEEFSEQPNAALYIPPVGIDPRVIHPPLYGSEGKLKSG